MTSSIDRRKFLKTAGATAAAGVLVATATDGMASASPKPNDIPIPFIPIFSLIGTTEYVSYTDLVVLRPASDLTYGPDLSAFAYPLNPASAMVATVPIPDNATVLSVAALMKGTGAATADLWVQDMVNGGFAPPTTYIGHKAVTNPTGQVSVPIPSGYKTVPGQKLQLWIYGATVNMGVAGVKFSYLPETAGFFPITPTRVYDSRDTGSGGPLGSGLTRDVSVANATAFSGGATNVVPAGAYAITYNLTSVDAVNQGFLAIFPKGGAFKASALNWFTTGEIVANGGVVTLGGDRQVTVQAGGGGSTNFIIDITGYYI